MDDTHTHLGFEDHPPRSPFALNVVTILVYVVAALVVFCWFIVMVDDARPFGPRIEQRYLPRGEVIRPTPSAARAGAPEERTQSPVRPIARAE
jgi:hypothetical protein